jgi:exodeoxyribonuclease V gamma subunit
MAGFNLYLSNRSQILVEELAKVVASPPLPPLEREIIVVQSQGMERWLVQQLSETFGIWANGWFPFPNLIIQEIIQAALKENIADSSFEPELMAWRLQRLLPPCLDSSGCENLKNYLASGNRDLKLTQLCHRIADTFDQYTLYRPEMILNWEKGEESHWQAQLWRRLVRERTGSHRAAVRQRFFEAIQREMPELSGLPKRISIFGIPALPPFHLDVFVAFSQFIKVHLFLMSPSREFWADIVSERELARKQQRQRKQYALPFPENHYFEVGNPLLASLGKLGRDFFGMLLDREGYVDHSRYQEPSEASLLACLQSDILNLLYRGRDGIRKVISTSDDSVQIHSCHSRMREIETLYDRLLALFDQHPDLRPNDIVVMCPDIEAYAPYVTAVFGGEREGQPRIPFSVSDHSAKTENPIAQGFFKFLDLTGGRWGVSSIMDLLDMPIVQHRLGIRPEDRDQILEWVKATGIRWGIDPEDRQRHGVPAFEENSWRAGLDRLLLGYALPSATGEIFAGILPFNAIEGSSTQVLGKFVEFLDQLFKRVRDLENPRTLASWSECLLALLSKFLAEEEDWEQEFQAVRRHLKRLADIQVAADYTQSVSLEAVRYYLERQIQARERSQMFLAGGVTFCAMLPMRSIPFRVIALLGMDNAGFPRASRFLSFDLMASHPRPGDRSLREEDRYLFLEALLSARDCLHISYVGQSARDNSEIPPSVVVSELMDSISQGFTLPDDGPPILEHLCFRHRLQAFSPSYFSDGSKLFSYSGENLAALKARRNSTWKPRPFVVTSIGDPPPELRTIDLRDLRRFFRNPTKFFLRRRLGVVLEPHDSMLEEREPFSLEALDGYALKQELVSRRLAGAELSKSYASVRGQGILPAGRVGDFLFRRVVSEVEVFTESLRPLLTDSRLPALDVDFDLAGFRLIGRIDDIWPNSLVRFRCATAKAKDHLDLWIDHLLVQCEGPQGYPQQSILVAQDGAWTFLPVDDPLKILEQLLKMYWSGLSKPLRFFPQSSCEYARRSKEGKNPQEAMTATTKVWTGTEWSRGECNDEYYELAFRQVKPLDETFANIAMDIFGPLLEHQEVRRV